MTKAGKCNPIIAAALLLLDQAERKTLQTFPDLIEALVGVQVFRDRSVHLVYSEDLCIQVLKKKNDWGDENAMDWVVYNTAQTKVGNNYCIVMHDIYEEPWL